MRAATKVEHTVEIILPPNPDSRTMLMRTVIDGVPHQQHHESRRPLTSRGMKIVAGRWLRSLLAAEQQHQ